MKCSKCDYPIKPDEKVCPACGTSVHFVQHEKLIQAIERMKAGEESAFTEVYDQTCRYVYQRAKYITNDDIDALDLMQEVYLALFKNAENIKFNESIFGWLKTVTLWQGQKFIERKRKSGDLVNNEDGFFEEIPDEGELIEENYVDQQDLNFVKKCIFELPEEQRLVVLAYYYDNLKVEEIAEQFEVSAGTIKSRLYLARKKLKLMISQQEEKQGYKFYAFGGPLLTAAIHSAMEDIVSIPNEQKNAVYDSLKNFLQTGSVSDLAAETVTTAAEMGEFVNESGQSLIRTIGTAILAFFAEFGAKKIAVGMVSISLATATAVTGYVTVNREPVETNRAEQRVVREEPVPDPKPGPIQVQNTVVGEPEEELKFGENGDDEILGDESHGDENRNELADPRAIDNDPEAQEPRYGERGSVSYGEENEVYRFTLTEERLVSVSMLGTTLNTNGTERVIEGRYILEIQTDSGSVVASTSGEMNGNDVILTEILVAGSYNVVLYNEATEMDLFDTLPYEIWIYY